jgi:hypothetical protein
MLSSSSHSVRVVNSSPEAGGRKEIIRDIVKLRDKLLQYGKGGPESVESSKEDLPEYIASK